MKYCYLYKTTNEKLLFGIHFVFPIGLASQVVSLQGWSYKVGTTVYVFARTCMSIYFGFWRCFLEWQHKIRTNYFLLLYNIIKNYLKIRTNKDIETNRNWRINTRKVLYSP